MNPENNSYSEIKGIREKKQNLNQNDVVGLLIQNQTRNIKISNKWILEIEMK